LWWGSSERGALVAFKTEKNSYHSGMTRGGKGGTKSGLKKRKTKMTVHNSTVRLDLS